MRRAKSIKVAMNFLPQGETVLQHDMVSDSHTFAGTERLRKWDTMRMWHDSFLRGAPTSGVGSDSAASLKGRPGAKGRPRRTGPRRSNLYRLCNRERILQFDAEVTHGAVHLRMAKQ